MYTFYIFFVYLYLIIYSIQENNIEFNKQLLINLLLKKQTNWIPKSSAFSNISSGIIRSSSEFIFKTKKFRDKLKKPSHH